MEMRNIHRLKLGNQDTIYILGTLSLLEIQNRRLIPSNFYHAFESLTHFMVEKHFFSSVENQPLVEWFRNNPTEISFWLDRWIFNSSIWQQCQYGIMFRPGDPTETAFTLRWLQFSKNSDL
jgi:hypothetical protein